MFGIFAMFFILFKYNPFYNWCYPKFFSCIFYPWYNWNVEKFLLDMMTITIAAITIGIAVDNSIHYIYRFKEEF